MYSGILDFTMEHGSVTGVMYSFGRILASGHVYYMKGVKQNTGIDTLEFVNVCRARE